MSKLHHAHEMFDEVVPASTSADHAQQAPDGLYGPSTPQSSSTSTSDQINEDKLSATPRNRRAVHDHYVVRQFKKFVGQPEDAPETVSVVDYIKENAGNVPDGVKSYVLSLFPFIQWLPRYNFVWLYGDLVAGITVGIVAVPQALSYATLATLQPQYGLYSAFIGVLTYAFFATSKDVSIGPVAVMSLQTANVISAVQASHPGVWSNEVIATALAFICGFIVLGLGLLRLGWIVEFIPQPAVSGFMTGSAISIAAGQVPSLFGISKRLNTRAATYEVIINTLKNLKFSTLDAALGVTALVTLYGLKWGLAWAGNRYVKFRRPSFFLTSFRHAFVVILYTIVAWRFVKNGVKISVLGTIPSGLRHVGQPYISKELISALASQLPASTILIFLEHIAVARAFSRINGYTINPDQELVAIGVNNTLSTLFGAFPSTGSFSRSALKSKAGVRTPAAGIPTGIVVLISLYALTGVFYYIPNPVISAIIIHAVIDLVSSPRQAYGFFRVAPLEGCIWLAGVLVTIFSSIENGIYTTIGASLVLLLTRVAIGSSGHFLGRVRIKAEGSSDQELRDVYVPMCGHGGITNPQVKIEAPPPGVIIYRFEQSFLYPNANNINRAIISRVKAETRRGKDMSGVSSRSMNWNEVGPTRRNGQVIENEASEDRPLLRAIIFDFSAVANLDTTGVQSLIDLRNEVEKWADQRVEFIFVSVLSAWVMRALVAGSFGYGSGSAPYVEVAPAIPPIDCASPPDRTARTGGPDIEKGAASTQSDEPESGKISIAESSADSMTQVLLSKSTPNIYLDLRSAMKAIAPGE